MYVLCTEYSVSTTEWSTAHLAYLAFVSFILDACPLTKDWSEEQTGRSVCTWQRSERLMGGCYIWFPSPPLCAVSHRFLGGSRNLGPRLCIYYDGDKRYLLYGRT